MNLINRRLKLRWQDRLAAWTIRVLFRIETTNDAVAILAAIGHCGWPRFKRAAMLCGPRQAYSKAIGRPHRLCWEFVKRFLPRPTVAFVHTEIERLTITGE